MMFGVYVLDLYCDIEYAHLCDGKVDYQFAGGKAQFTDEYGSRARAMARKAGWQIGRTHVVCPSCAKHSKIERRTLLRQAVVEGWSARSRRAY